jgi:hypothetical protein
MSRGTAAVLALGLLAGCSRRSGGHEQTFSSTRVIPGQPPVAAGDPGAAAVPHDTVEYDGAPLVYTVTQTLEASAAPRPDPDQGVVEQARVTAAGCFTGLAEGPEVRSASLQVTVVPTGTVSRTEVSADPDVTDCLRRVGDGLHFSDRSTGDSLGGGLRSFSIDVSVRRGH